MAVGVFAGLIVALGFVVFDMQKEERMLEQKYPEAVSSYERNLLYVRDLMTEQKYGKAESILRQLVQTGRGTENHAAALFLFANSLSRPDGGETREDELRAICREFIERYPTDTRVPYAHMMIAESFAREHNYADSNARYLKLLRILPDTEDRADVEFRIAKNYHDAGDTDAAAVAFEEIQQKYADSPVGWDASLMLAELSGESGDYNQSNRMLDRLIDEVPTTAHAAAALRMRAENAMHAGDHEHAIMYCIRWLKESPSMHHHADVMLMLSRANLEAGRPVDALAVASDITEYFPDSPRSAEAMVIQGKGLEALGRKQEAEDLYVMAAQAFPGVSSPHESLAQLYSEQGNVSAAIAQMEYARELAPLDDKLLLELAKLYRMNGENVKALNILESFSRERQLSVHTEKVFQMLADIYLELGRPHDAYRAISRYVGVATASADEATAYERRGDILAGVGLHDNAVEDYRQALKIGANPEDIVGKLAGSLLAGDRAEECLAELKPIDIASLPSNKRLELLELKARALVQLEMFEEARSVLRDALTIQGGAENIAVLALLMHIDITLQDEDAASQVYGLTLRCIESDGQETSLEAQRIILEWAEHLYKKDEYERAAGAYAHIQYSRFPARDAAWVLYQLGNCYYHMAEYASASEVYERLTSEYADSEWVEYALQKEKLMGHLAGI
jgi:TolA-binding protein